MYCICSAIGPEFIHTHTTEHKCILLVFKQLRLITNMRWYDMPISECDITAKLYRTIHTNHALHSVWEPWSSPIVFYWLSTSTIVDRILASWSWRLGFRAHHQRRRLDGGIKGPLIETRDRYGSQVWGNCKQFAGEIKLNWWQNCDPLSHDNLFR